MSAKDFDIIVQDEFQFLQSQHGCKLFKCNKEDWGYELIYLNNTTGVKITYEYRAAYISIMLYRLEDGKLHENPSNIDDSSKMYGYGLDDLITLRDPDSLVKPAYEYGEKSIYYNEDNGLALYVAAFANNLKVFAKDVLNGDFKIFASLDKIVKARLRKYR